MPPLVLRYSSGLDQRQPLKNNKHEHFAQLVAKGVNASEAYVSAGYSKIGAKVSASRLLAHANIRVRVSELQEALAGGTIELEISSRNARVQALQERWSNAGCSPFIERALRPDAHRDGTRPRSFFGRLRARLPLHKDVYPVPYTFRKSWRRRLHHELYFGLHNFARMTSYTS